MNPHALIEKWRKMHNHLIAQYGGQTTAFGNCADELEAALAAKALGKLGGKVKSAAKAAAARENGKKGGRPKQQNLISKKI